MKVNQTPHDPLSARSKFNAPHRACNTTSVRSAPTTVTQQAISSIVALDGTDYLRNRAVSGLHAALAYSTV
jgi:hypothetical protein